MLTQRRRNNRPDAYGCAGEMVLHSIRIGGINMSEEFQEYVTFHVTARDGSEVEMAVVDEFDYKKKHYVVASVVKDDAVDESGQYIYQAVMTGDDFKAVKITNAIEYQKIADAYLQMDQEGVSQS